MSRTFNEGISIEMKTKSRQVSDGYTLVYMAAAMSVNARTVHAKYKTHTRFHNNSNQSVERVHPLPRTRNVLSNVPNFKRNETCENRQSVTARCEVRAHST